jgi:2-keto-3-deoxy-L-rhamnonate aldolase RhmA
MAEVDEILEIPGLHAFCIAETDTAIALGHPMDYDHQDVWNFVDRVARKAKDRGIAVMRWHVSIMRALRIHASCRFAI